MEKEKSILLANMIVYYILVIAAAIWALWNLKNGNVRMFLIALGIASMFSAVIASPLVAQNIFKLKGAQFTKTSKILFNLGILFYLLSWLWKFL